MALSELSISKLKALLKAEGVVATHAIEKSDLIHALKSHRENPTYTDTHIIKPLSKHTKTLIWLHGLGDSSDGFVDAFEPSITHIDGMRVVLPNAPIQPVSMNGGMRMRAWFDLYSQDLLSREDGPGIHASHDRITSIITSECQFLGDSTNVFVGGFSQGAAMTIRSGLSCPIKLGALFVASGFLLERDTLKERLSTNISTPLLAWHGTDDPLLPPVIADTTVKLLQDAGVSDVRYKKIKGMGHSMAPSQFAEMFAEIKRDK